MPLKQRASIQNPCWFHVRLPSRRAIRPATIILVNTSAGARWPAARDAPLGRGELPQPCYFVGKVGRSSHGLHSRQPGVNTSAYKVHDGGHKRHDSGALAIRIIWNHMACCW